MQHSVEALAALVGGTVQGDGAALISGGRPIRQAEPGEITFVEDVKNARLLGESRASAAIVGPGVQFDGMPLIVVEKPRRAFGRIVQHLRPARPAPPPAIHQTAVIATTARIGRDVFVGPFASIADDVTIGDRCRIMPGVHIADGCRLGEDVVLNANVVLYSNTIMGNRVIVHAGAVIGADGFGYYHESGRHHKDFQLGHVEIEDDVEIGANTTIDRATFDVTRIGAGTKIDNQVMVAHNCRIGRHNLLVSQVGIAGSCKTGDYVVIAGQAGIGDHMTIGDGAVIGAMSGIMQEVPAGARMLGIPATGDREQVRLHILFRRLPEMRSRLEDLSRRINAMEERPELKKSA